MRIGLFSFKNLSFVNFVAGIVAAAMILIGGPTAYAYASQGEEAGCNGPIGSSTAPLGQCSGNVTANDVITVQNELWSSIFGTNEAPNLIYNMTPGTTFVGRGDYKGLNGYGATFKVHVYASVLATTVTAGAIKVTGWHVFACVTGPTETPVPVVGLMLDVVPIAGRGGSGPEAQQAGTGFVMAGRMSNDLDRDFRTGENGEAAANDGGLTGSQQACAAACSRTYAAQMALATAVYGAAVITATAVLISALAGCIGATVAFPPLGTLLGTGCALKALALYLVAVGTASLIYAAAMAAAKAAFLNCMAACGIIIVEA